MSWKISKPLIMNGLTVELNTPMPDGQGGVLIPEGTLGVINGHSNSDEIATVRFDADLEPDKLNIQNVPYDVLSIPTAPAEG